MILKPSTLAALPIINPNGYMISIYKQCIRMQKEAAFILNVPHNKLALDISEDLKKIYLRVDSDGFEILPSPKQGFVINNRQLCRFLLQTFKAEKRVNLALNPKAVGEGAWILTLKKKQ